VTKQKDKFHTTIVEVVKIAKVCSIVRPDYQPPSVVDSAYQPKIDLYLESVDQSSKFYKQMRSRFGWDFNSVAIEIHSPTSVKHFMGDLINAALNGDVGLVVCPSQEEQKQYERILRYIRHHGLISDKPYPLVVTAEEFIQLLSGQKT